MADKNFYGMALQLKQKYDRLVLQKNKIKKEVHKRTSYLFGCTPSGHDYSKIFALDYWLLARWKKLKE